MSAAKHIQIGVLSADKETRDFVANSYGKKGQSSDITLFTLPSKDILQTTILPEGYPSKPLSLVITAHMSDVLLLGASVSGIDANVGEAAILADCLQIPGIKAVMGPDAVGMTSYLDQMNKVFAKLDVSSWEGMIMSNNKEIVDAKNKMLKLFDTHRGNAEDYLAINVDHAFPVTGIGSVILGNVISGTVKKGQKITIYPEGQTGIVRSIQVNDEDVREAGPGVHVGLAMKGVLPKYLKRGTVITSDKDDTVKEVTTLEDIPIKKAAFGAPPKIGDSIHVVAGLFNATGKVISWGDLVTVEMDKAIPLHPKMRITFLDLNRKPSILGSRILE